MTNIEIREITHNDTIWYRPYIDGKRCAQIAETYDMAMLLALGIKYDGVNSQFGKMSSRMLNINSVWGE